MTSNGFSGQLTQYFELVCKNTFGFILRNIAAMTSKSSIIMQYGKCMIQYFWSLSHTRY